MESPVQGRSCIDIKETARQNTSIITSILPLHGLTGCDSVAATYGVGKTKAIAVARKGYKLEHLNKMSEEHIIRSRYGIAPSVEIHLPLFQHNMAGKQMTSTDALSHGTWLMEYLMLRPHPQIG